MTKTITILLPLLILLISCGEKPAVPASQAKEETPEALQDGYSISKVSRIYSNILEELYQELMDKDEALKKLDEEVQAQKKREEEMQEAYVQFDSKSEAYYKAVIGSLSTIKDIQLRNKMEAMMQQHKSKYESGSKGIQDWTELIAQKRISLADHHTALKIALTMEVMEKFQKSQRPEVEAYQKFSVSQDSLITEIKKGAGF